MTSSAATAVRPPHDLAPSVPAPVRGIVVPSRCVDSATIVVLGGSEQERGHLVSQLATAGLTATSTAQLPAGTPTLLVVTGAEAAYLVAEARDVPALAEIPILAIVPAVPPTAVAEALAAGATDVVRLPVPAVALSARCRNLMRLGRRDAGAALALSKI